MFFLLYLSTLWVTFFSFIFANARYKKKWLQLEKIIYNWNHQEHTTWDLKNPSAVNKILKKITQKIQSISPQASPCFEEIQSAASLLRHLKVELNPLLSKDHHALLEECLAKLNRFLPTTPQEIPSSPKKIDAILIDDQTFTHVVWRIHAENKKKTFLGFEQFHTFLESANQFHPQTPIYLDVCFPTEKKLSASEMAEKVYRLGFKQIFLCTGYPASEFESIPWIQGVRGKSPPF